MLQVTAYKRRTSDEEISFWANAAQTVLATIDGAADKVRVKVGRPGETPLLDIVSGTPLGGGSSVTATNPATVRFHQTDLAALTPAIYEIAASIVDASDSGVIKHAYSGTFNLLDTQTGGVS